MPDALPERAYVVVAMSAPPDITLVGSSAASRAPAVRRSHAMLPASSPTGWEVVLVDDGSDDGTAARWGGHGTGGNLRVLRLARRAGKACALRLGAEAAHGPWLLTMDGDLRNDPRDAARLMEEAARLGEGVAMVAGERGNRADTRLRRLSSRIGNGVRRAMLRDGSRDAACGLKLVARDALLAAPFWDGRHRFHAALFGAMGLEVGFAAVRDRERVWGRPKYGVGNRLRVGCRDLFGVCWLIRRIDSRPIAEEM